MESDENDLRERTKQFGLRILRMFSRLSKTTEARVLGKQILRSGTSLGANYREAYRGRSKSEFIAKCGDSLRALEETAYWLELLVEAKIVPPEKFGALVRECDELIAIFVTILKRSKEPFKTSQFILLPSTFLSRGIASVALLHRSGGRGKFFARGCEGARRAAFAKPANSKAGSGDRSAVVRSFAAFGCAD